MSLAKLKENYKGVFFGLVAAIIIVKVNPNYGSCLSFIKELPQLTSCIFGFLLALLGIILQGDSPTIKDMKSRPVMYNRFINYNKKVVYLSLILSVVTLVIGYIDYDYIDGLFISQYSCVKMIVKKIIISSITFGIVWLFVDLLTFLRLFYLLITAQSKK